MSLIQQPHCTNNQVAGFSTVNQTLPDLTMAKIISIALALAPIFSSQVLFLRENTVYWELSCFKYLLCLK